MCFSETLTADIFHSGRFVEKVPWTQARIVLLMGRRNAGGNYHPDSVSLGQKGASHKRADTNRDRPLTMQTLFHSPCSHISAGGRGPGCLNLQHRVILCLERTTMLGHEYTHSTFNANMQFKFIVSKYSFHLTVDYCRLMCSAE